MKKKKIERRKYKITIAEANEPFVKGLKIVIKEKGLKQAYVAEKAGFTAQGLSDMMNGRRLIKACDIPKLARTLGVKENEIYEAGEKNE